MSYEKIEGCRSETLIGRNKSFGTTVVQEGWLIGKKNLLFLVVKRQSQETNKEGVIIVGGQSSCKLKAGYKQGTVPGTRVHVVSSPR